MLRVKIALITALMVATQMSAPVSEVQAGPLLDWFRGIRCQAIAARKANLDRIQAANCNTSTAPTTAYANPCGLQPGQCQTTCMKTCSRTVVNYVPYTAYRSTWERVPVTQYKPVTNTDPCTGCTVTCMKPCTSYTYQMKRVPYTTYRPCYRTETYKVPVTTITNGCATGTCATGTCATGACGVGNTYAMSPALNPGCNTCATTPATTGNNGVYYTTPDGSPINAPSGTLSTEGGFGTPADVSPTLDVNPQTNQRSIQDRMNRSYTQQTTWPRTQQQPQRQESVIERTQQQESVPAYIGVDDKVARATVHQRWSYSPVRQASYTSTTAISEPASYEAKAQIRRTKPAIGSSTKDNAGWETVDW